MKNHNPSQKTTTSKQSPESSFVNSKKPNHHHTKNGATMDGVHTNQFIDKHTVEFSKIRRATTRPCAGWVLRAGGRRCREPDQKVLLPAATGRQDRTLRVASKGMQIG